MIGRTRRESPWSRMWSNSDCRRPPSWAAVTPVAVIAMLLLAVQYWDQPPLTRKFLNGRANKEVIAMVKEVVNGLSAPFFLGRGEFCIL